MIGVKTITLRQKEQAQWLRQQGKVVIYRQEAECEVNRYKITKREQQGEGDSY